MITVFLLHTVYVMKQANLCVGIIKSQNCIKKWDWWLEFYSLSQKLLCGKLLSTADISLSLY